jgi:hypothetical protein
MGMCNEPEQPETWDDIKELAPSLNRQVFRSPDVSRPADCSGEWVWKELEFVDNIKLERSE